MSSSSLNNHQQNNNPIIINSTASSVAASSVVDSATTTTTTTMNQQQQILNLNANSTNSHTIGNTLITDNNITDKEHALLLDKLTTTNSTTSSSSIYQSLWSELPKMDNFVDLFSIGCSTAVIFGGLIPYVPQYLKIKQSMNSDGFSTYVCLTLLIANILRITFWFGHQFELPLLFQSFVMIAGMLAMMEICVRVKDKHSNYTISSIGGGGPLSSRRRILTGKLLNNNNNYGLNNNNHPDGATTSESTPIYSVLRTSPELSLTTSSSSDLQFSTCSYQNSRPDSISSSIQDDDNITTRSSTSSNQQNPDEESVSIRAIRRRHNSQQSQQPLDQGNLKCFNMHNFWDWDDFLSYVKFLALFTFLISTLTYLLLDNYLYVESLGFIAVFTESMLGMPQLFKNYIKKSTRGMSVEMVAMWLSGDLFKTLYFIIRKAPIQFYVCGSIQVVVDILILGQVFWYRRPNVTYRKLPKST